MKEYIKQGIGIYIGTLICGVIVRMIEPSIKKTTEKLKKDSE